MPPSIGKYKGTEITPGTDAEVSKQIQAIDASSISSGSLKDAPSLDIAQPAPAGKTSGMLGYFDATGKNLVQSVSQQATDTKGQADTSFEEFLRASLGQETSSQATDRLYKTEVDPLRSQVTEFSGKLMQEQEYLRQQERSILENKQGYFGTGQQQALDKARTESLDRQASISVSLAVAQGRYQDAREVADRAVQAQMEIQKNQLDALKLNYERHQDLFTTAEKREFDLMLSDRERELDFEMYQKKTAYDQAIKQSDPLYQLQLMREQKELSLLGEPTEKERREIEASVREAQASIPVLNDKIAIVDVLKTHPGLDSRVGSTPFSRGPRGIVGTIGRVVSVVGIPSIAGGALDTLTGSGQDFAGAVHKLVGGLTLDNLIAAKARGATFGALSDAELQILANSASAINDWEIKDDNGKPTGFWDIDEASFKREFDTIKKLTQRAIELSGGSLLSEDENILLDEIYQVQSFSPAGYF